MAGAGAVRAALAVGGAGLVVVGRVGRAGAVLAGLVGGVVRRLVALEVGGAVAAATSGPASSVALWVDWLAMPWQPHTTARRLLCSPRQRL